MLQYLFRLKSSTCSRPLSANVAKCNPRCQHAAVPVGIICPLAHSLQIQICSFGSPAGSPMRAPIPQQPVIYIYIYILFFLGGGVRLVRSKSGAPYNYGRFSHTDLEARSDSICSLGMGSMSKARNAAACSCTSDTNRWMAGGGYTRGCSFMLASMLRKASKPRT